MEYGTAEPASDQIKSNQTPWWGEGEGEAFLPVYSPKHLLTYPPS